MKNNQYCLIGLLLLASTFFACKDNQFEQDGNRQYIAKPELIVTKSGKNRLQVSFVVPNNQITSAKVFWNNRQNSKDVPLSLATWPSTVNTVIGPLEEGDYTFEVILYNNNGSTSIPVKVTGTALGAKYESTLANRPIKDIFYENNIATIYWGDAVAEQQTEVTFTDVNNISRKVIAPFAKDTTQLLNFKPATLSTTIQYKTAYLPAGSLDTYYANAKTETVITGSLRDLAKAKDVGFGTRLFWGYGGTNHGIINDPSPNGIYTALAKTEFNVGQAYWGATRWKKEGNSDFNEINACINWFKTYQDKAMVTLIVGPNNYMPDWFINGTFTPDEMDLMLKNLITEFAQSNDNKNKVDVMNVANELFNNDGTYRDMKWNDMGWEPDASGQTGVNKINLQHPKFVGKAFQYCRAAFTKALLELRDYDFEHDVPGTSYYTKHKALYQLLKHMKAKGYPIDVVGVQAHYTIGDGILGGYEEFKNTIKKFRTAGVEVYLTELDLVSKKVNSAVQPWTTTLAEQQKIDYYNTVKAAIEAGVNVISLWGLRDDNDPTWRIGQNPLIIDINYKRKPAYYGVQKALFEAKK